jgi:TonB family protein
MSIAMQRILLLLLTCFIIANSAAVRAQVSGIGPGVEWRIYTVKDEEFSVSLPGFPAMMTSEGLRKADGKRRLERLLKTSVGGVDFYVETFENPEPGQTLEQFIAEQGLDSYYDRSTERKLTIDGFDGIEYSSSSKTTPPARVQIFATEKHLYRFITRGQDAGQRSIGALFFSSIKLGKKLDGIEVPNGSGSSSDLQSDTGERIFTGREVDTKARLVSKPPPVYTDEARNHQVSGTVILKVIVSKSGQVTNIRVVSGLPFGLTEQAIKAAKGIKFIPAMKDGQPVSMWMQLEYNFDL